MMTNCQVNIALQTLHFVWLTEKVTLSLLRVTSLSDVPCRAHSLVVLYPINLFVPLKFNWKSDLNLYCE